MATHSPETAERERIAAATRSLRALHDLTQPAMADRVGLSEQAYRALEHGDLASARSHVLAVCNAAGVNLEEFARLQELFVSACGRLAALNLEP